MSRISDPRRNSRILFKEASDCCSAIMQSQENKKEA